jgi:broad specificity phosphatase PhoE
VAYSPASLLNPLNDFRGTHDMVGSPALYFFRHGQTDLNAENAFRGFMDVDLDEAGKEQAREQAKYAKEVPFTAFYSSDLKRAKQTMKFVQRANFRAQDLIPEIVAAGRPWNVGKFSGKPKNAANKQELQMYADSGETIPGGESLGQFRSRFGKLFQDVIDKAVGSGGPVGLFGHASNGHEIGNIVYGDIDRLDTDPGGIVCVYISRGGLEARVMKGAPQQARESQYAS